MNMLDFISLVVTSESERQTIGHSYMQNFKHDYELMALRPESSRIVESSFAKRPSAEQVLIR